MKYILNIHLNNSFAKLQLLKEDSWNSSFSKYQIPKNFGIGLLRLRYIFLVKKKMVIAEPFWLTTYVLNPFWIHFNPFFFPLLVNNYLKSSCKMYHQILPMHFIFLGFTLDKTLFGRFVNWYTLKSLLKISTCFTCIAPSCTHTRWHNRPFISCWIIILHCR